MAEYTIHLRSLRGMPKQAAMVASTAKRKIVRAGRRSAKTTTLAQIDVEAFLAGKRVLYGAPTEDQVGRYWAEVKRALREPLDAGVFYKNETKHIIGYPDLQVHIDNDDNDPNAPVPGEETRIRAKTAWNADTWRGDYADKVTLDEYQLMSEEAWGIVIAPMMLDTNGDAVFSYTPPSLHSRSATKAQDIRHASKLYALHEHDKEKPDWDGRWECFHFTSRDNPHLSQIALEELLQDMTAQAIRQEIDAEDSDEAPGALWHRRGAMVEINGIARFILGIEENRVDRAPELIRSVVGVDPTGSTTGDACGIVGAGMDEFGEHYTLADDSLQGSPDTWVRQVARTFYRLKADLIVAEKNYGGEMVEQVIRDFDPALPVKLVSATRGKAPRAEPISALTERGRDHMVGKFEALEDELCQWVPGDKKSPNRLDAKVWADTELQSSIIDNESGNDLGHVEDFESRWSD
jgi:hypothetical protein